MKNIDLLVASMDYIEAHIHEDLKTSEIAEKCFCSKSTLEKLFRCVNMFSVQDYVKRRRMTLAAKSISTYPDKSILEIAIEYGYSSHEAFARAFKEVWNCNPSEFRGKKYWELFPKLRKPISEGECYMMQRKNVDISELYDLFTERKNCWFICCDIRRMIEINDISRKAGDMAIVESMKRMDKAAGENDMIFRIGGDEFCILTDSESVEYADSVVKKLTDMNDGAFECDGRNISLVLHVSKVKCHGEHIKYNELFHELHMTIKNTKDIVAGNSL